MQIEKTIKVALVDDHPMMREVLGKLFNLWGYKVILQACNGHDLLNQLQKTEPPDICTVDLNMPHMNGYDTLHKLRQLWPAIKTLVYSMNIDAHQSTTNGVFADAVVSKAAPVTVLKSQLAKLCSW